MLQIPLGESTMKSFTTGFAVVIASLIGSPAYADQDLQVGEYACYSSGGSVLIGLGFKVLGQGHYSDLDGKTSGEFGIDGDAVVFKGGHLDGQTGRQLKDHRFTINGAITCEPFN